MPDRIFADPRLAAIYDDVDSDRSDLEPYEAIVDELEASGVVDTGLATLGGIRGALRDGGHLVFIARARPIPDAVRPAIHP